MKCEKCTIKIKPAKWCHCNFHDIDYPYRESCPECNPSGFCAECCGEGYISSKCKICGGP